MNIFRKVSFVFLGFAIVFLSGYALSTVEPYSNFKTFFVVASLGLAIFLFIFNLLSKNSTLSFQKVCQLKSFKVFLLCVVICSITTLVNFSFLNINSTIFFLLLLCLSFLFSLIVPFKRFLQLFINVMIVISLIALFGFLLTDLLGFDPGFGLVTNINGTTYQNGFFWFRIKYAEYSSRAMGIFWEPGLLASFSSIALISTLLINQKFKYLKSFVFILSIVVSQSTAGLILLLMSLVVVALQTKGIKRYFFATVMVLVAVFVLFFFGDIYNYLSNSSSPLLQKLSFGVETTSVRVNSVILNLEIFKQSPLFGVGLGEANVLFSQMAEGTYAQTSTSTYYMASFGVFGILYSVLLAFVSFRIGMAKKSFFIGLIVFSILLFIVNKEPHSSFLVDFILLFYLSNNLRNVKVKSNENIQKISRNY